MSNLTPEWTLGALSLTDYPYSVIRDSFDPGQPSLNDEPREMSIKVGIEGADLLELADNEAALRREINKDLNEFGYTPGDGFAPTTMYDTTSITAKSIRYEDGGEQTGYREWELSIDAESYARSANATTVTALAAGTSEVVVDDCSSLTGWAAAVSTPADSISQSAGAVWAHDAVGGNDTVGLRRAASIDVSTRPYFKLEWKAHPGPGFTLLGLPASATPFPSEFRRVALGDGWMRSTWLVSPGDLDSGFQFAYLNADSVTTEGDYLAIREVGTADIPPGVTSRQQARIVEVGGTERTPGSIHVAAPDGSSALALTIVSTFPGRYADVGFDPAMSRWYVSGTRTADATTVSGWRFRCDDAYFTSELPSSSMPDGGYQMVSLMRMSVAGTYRVQSVVQAKQGGVTLAEWTNEEILLIPDDWYLVDMGVPTMPILRAHSDTETELAIRVTDITGAPLVGITAEVQDSWFFPVDEDCGLTALLTSKPHLWLDSPTAATGAPRIYVGDEADRTGSTFPPNEVHTFGQHTLTAGSVGMTVIATGVEYPETDVTYFKRWLNNAAEDG